MVSTWTPDRLAETVWALRRLLRLGHQTGAIALTATTTTDAYGAKVEEWLRTVEPVLEQVRDQADDGSLSVPSFPLSGTQLTELETVVQRALTERAALQRGQRKEQQQGQYQGRQRRRAAGKWERALALGASLDHLHGTLADANRSSHVMIEAVVGLFAVNTLYLVLLLVFREQVVLTIKLVALALSGNLAVIALIAALWWWHHTRLHHHWRLLGLHTAMRR